jgi:cardiolipin synthase
MESGAIGFPRMLAAMDSAERMIRLEMYLVRPGPLADEFLAVLLQAVRRGVHVRVLLDAVGSSTTILAYFAPLSSAGAEVRLFNPWTSRLVAVRNHRKLLVCDEDRAFVVGFNLGPEYAGDGVESGWRDLGMEWTGAVAVALARSFDYQFLSATHRQRRGIRFRHRHETPALSVNRQATVYSIGPGRGHGAWMEALARSIRESSDILLITPYFCPPGRFRRLLRRAAARGARVRLVLPGPTDVPLAKMAARWLYSGLMMSGVEVWEYQPQVLHTKLYVMDDTFFQGSANLDVRSFHLNFEIMMQWHGDRQVTDRVRREAEDIVAHSVRVDPRTWQQGRSFRVRFRERLAYLTLAQLDPWIAWRLLAKGYA